MDKINISKNDLKEILILLRTDLIHLEDKNNFLFYVNDFGFDILLDNSFMSIQEQIKNIDKNNLFHINDEIQKLRAKLVDLDFRECQKYYLNNASTNKDLTIYDTIMNFINENIKNINIV